jgi:hypothetical protein
MRFIIDTCIWLDFFQDRLDYSGKPIGKYAADFIMAAIAKKHTIFIADAIIFELANKNRDISFAFFGMEKVLTKIFTSKKDSCEARKLSIKRNLPRVDCLIAIHARNYDAIAITRDKHLLYDLADICQAQKPEYFIFDQIS